MKQTVRVTSKNSVSKPRGGRVAGKGGRVKVVKR